MYKLDDWMTALAAGNVASVESLRKVFAPADVGASGSARVQDNSGMKTRPSLG